MLRKHLQNFIPHLKKQFNIKNYSNVCLTPQLHNYAPMPIVESEGMRNLQFINRRGLIKIKLVRSRWGCEYCFYGY